MLSKGLTNGGVLSEDSIKRTINALSFLKEKAIKEYKVDKLFAFATAGVRYAKNKIDFINNELNYKNNITNKQAATFYKKCNTEIKEYGLEHPSHKDFNGKQLMETKHCLKYSLGFCSKQKGPKLIEPLFLIDEKNQKYELDFDCKNCRMKLFYKKT